MLQGMSGLWTWDPETGAVTWSGSIAPLHGLTEAASTYADVLAAAHPDDRAALDAVMQLMVETTVGQQLVYRSAGGDLLSTQGQLITVSGRPFVVGSVRPVAPLQPEKQHFIDLLQSFPAGVCLLDDEARFVEVNEAFADLLGYPQGELLHTPYPHLVHPDDVEAENEGRSRVLMAEVPLVRAEHRLVRRDGAVVWALITTRRFEEDGLAYTLSAIEDITARKLAEDQLVVLALHDSLTGLPNRRLLLDRLEGALSRSRRNGRDIAVLFVDVDHLKRVNDELGHEAGDELLRGVAKNLLSVVRDSDTVARLGGDEFVVVCEQVGTPDELEVLARRMLQAIHIPVVFPTGTLVVSASIGIVTPSAATDRPQDLLRAADGAMYRAKRGGRGRYVVDVRPDPAGRRSLGLESEIARGLDRDEFVLHYQPIVGLDGTLDSVEALIRWRHPQRGLLAPAAFLPTVSATSLAEPVTRWVLQRAIRDATEWLPEGVPVSVNIAVERLRSPEFSGSVTTILADADLPPRSLRLELLEDQLAETEPLVHVITALADLGVGFCVDDFGTGYSSLAYLKKLPIGVVKIDRSLVAGICEDPAAAAVVKAVLDACRSTGRLTVGEGVETADQLRLLRALGCDAIQGALTGMPAPIELLRDVLAARRVELSQHRQA
jgi:diguanylate cyclase (GGDEF)-like protein/PAS domain S-box-containing protein